VLRNPSDVVAAAIIRISRVCIKL